MLNISYVVNINERYITGKRIPSSWKHILMINISQVVDIDARYMDGEYVTST